MSSNKFLVFIFMVIFLVWLSAYPLSRYISSSAFMEPTTSIYNAINVLFTALAFTGVIITFHFQSLETERASKELVERSIFELFLAFTSESFQKVKDDAFLSLLVAVKDKQYAVYIASRLFPIERKNFPESALLVYQTLRPELKDKSPHDMMDIERSTRLHLDNILNFFSMLSNRQTAASVIKHVDFAYDWWRPTLWIIAQLQKEIKDGSKEIAHYCRNPMLHLTLEKLDKIYGYPPIEPSESVYQYLQGHPWLQEQHIDPAFFKAA